MINDDCKISLFKNVQIDVKSTTFVKMNQKNEKNERRSYSLF